MINFERKWILPFGCLVECEEFHCKLKKRKEKKKKAMIIQSDCFIAIILYIHTYIIFIDGVGYFHPRLYKLNFILEIS